MTDQREPDRWHLDKRVPLSIIGVLLLQIAGFGMIYGKLENRVTNIENRVSQTEDSFRQVPERLARVEALLEILVDRLERSDDRRAAR